MKLNGKTIIANTVLFIIIIGFILGFGAMFGNENILIGVSTITAMLMLLERDLTSHPVGNTAKFVILNLFIGLAAFFAQFNVWLAVPINFVTMFVISYSLLFNLKNPLYLPFSLQYLFALAVPVAADQLPLRLASLVFGALAIMAVQMLVNKKKITKSGDQKIRAICEAQLEKIKHIQEGLPVDELSEKITQDISGLRSIIYDKREENYYLSDEGRMKLNVSVALEKLDLLIDQQALEQTDPEILQDITELLALVPDGLQDQEKAEQLEQLSDELLRSYKAEHNHHIPVIRMLNHLEYLKDNVLALQKLGKKRYHTIAVLEKIPNKFRKLTVSETPSHTNSIKLSYAVRMAVGISLAGFITDFFDLTEGRWMMFTILSVIIPLYEQSQKKMRDRIFATATGAVIVAVLFYFFQGNTARSIILMGAGYLMNYVKVYRYSTILVTISAIGSVALVTGETNILTLERAVFVAAGVVAALLINRFILPYRLEDANRDLREMYNDTLGEMITEVSEEVKGRGKEHAIKNLLLITTMIEDRIKLNNQSSESQELDWLKYERRAAGTLYELHGWIQKHGILEANLPAFHSGMDVLLHRQSADLRAAFREMKERIGMTPRIEDRISLGMMAEVMLEMDRTNKNS